MTNQAEVLFEGLHFVQTRHGNKGYARDPATGEYLRNEDGFADIHMGYAWYYRCVELPRLQQVVHIMHPLCGDWLEWHVDGEKCIDADEALARINEPPQLTLAQYWAWMRLGPEPHEYDKARNVIAGCVSDHPNFIHFDEPWGKAARLIDELRDKGLVYYHNDMLHRRDK